MDRFHVIRREKAGSAALNQFASFPHETRVLKRFEQSLCGNVNYSGTRIIVCIIAHRHVAAECAPMLVPRHHDNHRGQCNP
jgi:hypothetical protein